MSSNSDARDRSRAAAAKALQNIVRPLGLTLWSAIRDAVEGSYNGTPSDRFLWDALSDAQQEFLTLRRRPAGPNPRLLGTFTVTPKRQGARPIRVGVVYAAKVQDANGFWFEPGTSDRRFDCIIVRTHSNNREEQHGFAAVLITERWAELHEKGLKPLRMAMNSLDGSLQHSAAKKANGGELPEGFKPQAAFFLNEWKRPGNVVWHQIVPKRVGDPRTGRVMKSELTVATICALFEAIYGIDEGSKDGGTNYKLRGWHRKQVERALKRHGQPFPAGLNAEEQQGIAIPAKGRTSSTRSGSDNRRPAKGNGKKSRAGGQQQRPETTRKATPTPPAPRKEEQVEKGLPVRLLPNTVYELDNGLRVGASFVNGDGEIRTDLPDGLHVIVRSRNFEDRKGFETVVVADARTEGIELLEYIWSERGWTMTNGGDTKVWSHPASRQSAQGVLRILNGTVSPPSSQGAMAAALAGLNLG